jgi:ubiquinone/menaquinone biosynthesis C-methylase UbiE
MRGRQVLLRELLLGIEGLALLRGLYDADDDEAQRRVDEMQGILEDPACSVRERTCETDARSGYAVWAETYDDGDNPIISLEQAIVWKILAAIPPGRALDAACGTGRHAERLVRLRHDVVGVDLTAAMLARARARVPDAEFLEGDLRAIPAADEQFDVIVCGLALAHLEDLARPVAEFVRVLKPGGRLVISVLHPFQAMLGWQAPFAGRDGRRAFVREYPHSHSEYLAAFTANQLRVLSCAEPRLTEALLRSKRRAFERIPEATVAAYAGLPAVLVWDLENTAP